MNKADIIESVAVKLDSSKADAARAVDAVLESIKDGLKKDGDVSFVGFGSFSVKNRDAYVGRNPKTGAPLDIPAAKVVGFKPGQPLKDEINSK